ncbi:hypothetical protein, partial [Klebsiella pneumoniae]|uniref:hypothetical protein n=1 Tax=Klebsiella pneumoniae TaxID=573 RepID=UPI003A803105
LNEGVDFFAVVSSSGSDLFYAQCAVTLLHTHISIHMLPEEFLITGIYVWWNLGSCEREAEDQQKNDGRLKNLHDLLTEVLSFA